VNGKWHEKSFAATAISPLLININATFPRTFLVVRRVEQFDIQQPAIAVKGIM
jgi:hypothetical protein